MSLASQVWKVIYYVLFPIIYLLCVLLNTVLLIAAPLIYLGRFLFSVCAYPFQLIPKLEVSWVGGIPFPTL